jgi:hypothetical protein
MWLARNKSMTRLEGTAALAGRGPRNHLKVRVVE